MITHLEPHQFFVFGSNMLGSHSAGAAKQAVDDFGAEWGIPEGLTGKSYAFPTLEREMTKRGIPALERSRDKFYATANALPDYEFLLTKVGCGIAGYDEKEMKFLFRDTPINVVKPEDW